MNDTRLTDDELDLFVSFAYGGPAWRAGRQAQAQALSNLLTGKPLDGCRRQACPGVPDPS